MNPSTRDRLTLLPPKAPPWWWRNDIKWPWDFRKFMGWVFLINSITYLFQSIFFLSIQHSAFPAYIGVLGGPIFSAVVAIVCAVAWWKARYEACRARNWAIAASLTFIAIFIRPFVIPLQPVWGRHIGALLIGVVGLVLFLRRGVGVDAESAS